MNARRGPASFVPWYTAGLAGVAVLLAVLAPRSPATPTSAWAAAVPFVVLLTAAGALQLQFRYRDDVEAVDIFDAALTPIVFLFSPPVAVAFAAVGKGVSQGLLRVAPRKAAFNVAQWMCATAAGSMVLNTLRHGRSLRAANLGALALAGVVLLVVNLVAFVGVLCLAGERSPRAVLADLRQGFVAAWLLGGGANLALGILFTAAFRGTPWSTPFFFVPLGMMHWASHGYAEARVDRSRLAGLQRATHVLAQPVNPRDALGAFLVEVRACFEAEAVDALLVGPGGYVVHRLTGSGPGSCRTEQLGADDVTLARVLLDRGQLVRVDAGYPDLMVATALRIEGWRNCLAAPLRSEGAVTGVLCTYNRTGVQGGFEHGELAVLDALSAELSRALERAQLVELVLEEQAKLAEIVGRTSDGITTIAPDGTVTSWNPAMAAITGHHAEATVGAKWLGMLRPRDATGHDVMLERWREHETLPGLISILTATGETRWLSCSWTRVAGAGEPVETCILVARDVTEAHKLEQIKQEFVSTVSHELRTPLAPILGWATTLLQRSDELTDDDRQRGLESILRQGQRMERLVLNLLEVSKIEAGAGAETDAEIDAALIARRVVEELGAAWPQRSIVLDVPPRPCPAIGNELWVEQIVTNLVSNAIKYAPDTEPIVVRARQQPGVLELSVVDHGPGIPPELQRRIFERFERYAQADTQAGTGLGLYIARQLADAMGAELSVESDVGRGAEFSLQLRAPVHLVAVS